MHVHCTCNCAKWGLAIGTFILHDSTISVEGNRFLLTEFHSCSEPSSPMRPRTSLVLQKATSQNQPRSTPCPYLSISQSHKEISILSGMCTCGFQSPHPPSAAVLQDLGCAVLGLHVAVPEQCALLHCPRGWSPGSYMSLRGTLPPGVGSQPLQGLSLWWALHILVPRVLSSMWGAGPESQNIQMPKTQRKRESLHQALKSHSKRVTPPYILQGAEFCNSAFPVTIQLQAPLMCLCLAWQVLAAPSALLPSSPGRQALQTSSVLVASC